MNRLFHLLARNKVKIGVLYIILIIVIVPLQLPPAITLTVIYLGIGLIYFICLFISMKRDSTVLQMIMWLLNAPLITSYILVTYISLNKDETSYVLPFSSCFLLFFVFIWSFAALRFEEKKIKTAMFIVNAITLILIALILTINLGFDASNLLDGSIIDKFKDSGYTSDIMIEILLKIILFPYLLGGLCGTAVLNIRELKSREKASE